MKNINKIIFGSSGEVKLEKKIFLLLLIVSAFVIIIGNTINILLHSNIILVILIFIALVIVIYVYFASLTGNNYTKYINFLFIFSLVVLSGKWVLDGGYNGNTLSLFLVYFLSFYVIVPSEKRILVFLSFLFLIIGLAIVQYKFEGVIVSFENEKQRFFNIIFGNILYFFFLYFMVNIILKIYKSENEKVNKINLELNKKNYEIERWSLMIIESEEKFRRIADQVPDVIFLIDKQGFISFVSPAAKNIFGREPEEMKGKLFINYLLETEVEKAVAEFNKTLNNNNNTKELPLIIKKADGSLLNVELNASMFFENGEIFGTIGIIRDVSERIIVQEEITILSKVVEQSPACIMITDVNGDIEYVNAKFIEVTGYEPSELYGQNPSVLKTGYQSQEFYKVLWDTILTGMEWKGELYNKKKNGVGYWEMVSIFPIKNERAEITHFIALKQDISERKLLMEQLIAAKEKAEESDKLKSAFLANMSHEIRTPLNGILGFSKLLNRKNIEEDKRQKYVNIIKKNSDSLLHIISDILDISKIESGQLEIESQEVDINKLITEITLLYKQKINGDFLFSNNLAESDLIIRTDEFRLRQVLINLLDNAIKFTENGYVKFGIDRIIDDKIFFIVEDTGIGIPPENIENIFKRFRQSEGQKMEQRGNGLGLAIVKQLIELMNGEIYVQSKENYGTVFTFWLPINYSEYTEPSIG